MLDAWVLNHDHAPAHDRPTVQEFLVEVTNKIGLSTRFCSMLLSATPKNESRFEQSQIFEHR